MSVAIVYYTGSGYSWELVVPFGVPGMWHSQILGSFELSLVYGQNRPSVAHFLAQK